MSENGQLLRQSSLKKAERPNVRRKNRHVLISVPDGDPNRPYQTKTKILLVSLATLVVVSALAGFFIGKADYNATRRQFNPPDPIEPLKPSASRLHMFRKAAVCTDAPQCSEIGKQILLKNGSAVDAAIGAMFCNGLLNQQSMGLGGGFFMTVFIKDEEQAYTVNAREKAPGKATVNMYEGDSEKSSKGPQAAAVPGELRGLWVAHQRWGKLPWESLVNPTLDICNEGFVMSKAMYDGLLTAFKKNPIKEDENLKKMYVDSAGEFHKPGSLVKPSDALCKTFDRIAKNGGDDLYNGSLAKDFLDDLQKVGSLITAGDLETYEFENSPTTVLEQQDQIRQILISEEEKKAKVTAPLSVPLGNGEILYTPPPPSSGVILANILNILSGYHFNSSSINTTEDKILTYHRIVEAFKYAYSTRTKLGDSDFLDLQALINNVTSPDYGNEIRLRINDTMTSNDTATYGATEYNQPDYGTAHISIIANNGDAVSVTSSINFYYGAGFSTLKTGILMNNVMDDFSSPGITNFFGLKPSPANFIAPGKRPLSSMSPSIVVDKNGNVNMVIGASGGTKITTAVALVAMRKLWFNQTIKEAVDEPRFHHQIFPMNIAYEFGITEDIVNGLRAKGHGLQRYRDRGSNICALFRNGTTIYANADYRKGGDVSGMN